MARYTYSLRRIVRREGTRPAVASRATARRVRTAALPPPPSLDSLKKADLVALADERGLDTSGTKADLIGRLDE